MMIRITQPWIEIHDGKSRCLCNIFVDDELRTIWFDTSEEYGDYLCIERGDAYLIGLLNWAMRRGDSIVSDIPITEELYYNITVSLIPSLVKYSKGLHPIDITCKLAPAITQGTAVGTGCSCGVDSFTTIYKHMDNEPFDEFSLTHLCINNVGAFAECYSEYGKEKTKTERYAISQAVAKELSLPLIVTDSNFADVFEQDHLLSHTYSSVFAIYMLQKLWKKYYYSSSGHDYSEFSLIDNDTKSAAFYELLSLQCFSTFGLRIYSDGGEMTRLEKTELIADYSIAQKRLHVCLTRPYNCGKCDKCLRTLLTLDCIGKLESFSNVFDIEEYKRNREDAFLWLYKIHTMGDGILEPVYEKMLNREDYLKVVTPLLEKDRKIYRKHTIKTSMKTLYKSVFLWNKKNE